MNQAAAVVFSPSPRSEARGEGRGEGQFRNSPDRDPVWDWSTKLLLTPTLSSISWRRGSSYALLSSILTVLIFFALSAGAADTNHFTAGVQAYRANDFATAAQAFRASANERLSAGALQNLGNAEWQLGRVGTAILAWEQALWVDPAGANARSNLRFARESAQLEAPEFTWFEQVSLWLPTNGWSWVTAISLWLAVGALTLPAVLRRSRATWHQALAALGLGIFLFSLPAQFGTFTRTRLGFILQKDTPLRLTPTAEAEAVTRLAAGEPARRVRTRGNYVFIRTNHAAGWVDKRQFGLIFDKQGI
jgi:tetratricopeptide (TPR) repeat protein